MKRIRYGKIFSSVWAEYREILRQCGNSQRIAMQILDNRIEDMDLPDGNKLSLKLQLGLFSKELDGELPHYYLKDESLKTFLDYTPVHEISSVNQYIREEGISQIVRIDGKMDVATMFSIALFVPYENNGYVVSFLRRSDGEFEVFVGYKRLCLVSSSIVPELRRRTDNEAKELLRFFNFAVNLMLYIKTFPECIVDGVPSGITDEKTEIEKARCRQLETSSKLLASNSSGRIMPAHYRRGYFKVLRSEYFTHKRGQVIFVDATVVHGKGKTILTKENIKLKN